MRSTTRRGRFAARGEFVETGVIHSRDLVDGECPPTRLPELFKQMAAGNRVVKTLIWVRE